MKHKPKTTTEYCYCKECEKEYKLTNMNNKQLKDKCIELLKSEIKWHRDNFDNNDLPSSEKLFFIKGLEQALVIVKNLII